MTLCIDFLHTFSCIIHVFYSFVLLTVHLCAIVTRFNKCNLLTLTLVHGHKSRGDRGDMPPPAKCGTGDVNTSCPPPKYGAYMLQFQLASNYINIFILVFDSVRCFNTASFASKKFGPESSLSSSPQISHQVYAPALVMNDTVKFNGQRLGSVTQDSV